MSTCDQPDCQEMRTRLAWREQQARATLTPTEYRTASMRALASITALQDSDTETLERNAPRNVGEMRAALSVYAETLAGLAHAHPDLLETLSNAVLDAIPTQEN